MRGGRENVLRERKWGKEGEKRGGRGRLLYVEYEYCSAECWPKDVC